ncbi:hypothetical protein D3C78_1395530 [compost metagenome]
MVEKPIQVSHFALNSSDCRYCGRMKAITAKSSVTTAGARRNSSPTRLAAAILCNIPKKMKLSGKAK